MGLSDRIGFAVCAMAGLFFLACVLANLSVLLRWAVRGRTGSMIPFIGGLAGCVAMVALPWPDLSAYWWIALVVDVSYVMCISGWIHRCAKSRR